MSPAVRGVLFRLVKLLLVVLFVSFATFAMLTFLPGNLVDSLVPEGATDEQRQIVIDMYHLDDPLLVRYWFWFSDAIQGQFGRSLATAQPVSDILANAMPVTFELAGLAVLFAILFSVPLAVYSAYRQGGIVDRILSTLNAGFLSIPNFLLGLLALYVIAIEFGWFPITGWRPFSAGLWEHYRYLVLPVLTLAIAEGVVLARVLRADMITTLSDDFVLAARARGLSVPRVLFIHALRPASFSLITVLGVSFGRLLGGAVVVESIFSIPGLGTQLIKAIGGKDYPVVQAIVLILAIVYVLANLIVDLLYPLLDPRVRTAR